MTLACPDSTDLAALPPGYGQYLGYVDGQWITVPELRKRFPAARIIGLTVTAAPLDATGIDCEPGNPDAAQSADWAAAKLAAVPGSRPVIYASVIGEPGYGMAAVLGELAKRGIARNQVRLLTAHYGHGEHICGPGTCGLLSTEADGTQWTDKFPGAGGALVDMSALRDDFFGVPTWTEAIVQQLPTVQQGMTGEGVRTAQGALVARHHEIAVDGIFGTETATAVRVEQSQAHIAVDGIVGQHTWPVLLGIA